MEKRTALTLTCTIGIDLGDRRSAAFVLDAGGEETERRWVPTTSQGITRFFERRKPCRVVLEVGTHSPWVSRLIASRGHEVVVANPRELTSIARRSTKTDFADAEQLARLGRVDPKLLAPVHHRGEQAQRDRALLAVRAQLVEARTRLVVQARGLAKAQGQRLPRSSASGFARKLRAQGLEHLFPGLQTLVAILQELSARIAALDRQIDSLCQGRYPETELLRQIQGVGPITALAYVLTLEDPHRFAKSRTVGSYLGLRPKKRQSGERDPQLGITKQGDRYLRTLLVQAAHYILGPFGSDTDLRRFGERLISRGGKAAKRRAIVAVARKLAVLLHRLWVTAEVYEPLRNTAAHAQAASEN
jgi:transposase